MSWDISYDYDQAELNITRNYAWFYYKAINCKHGLRILDGMPAYQVIDVLTDTLRYFGVSYNRRQDQENYWAATPTNAMWALHDLRVLSRMVPSNTIIRVR